MLEREYVKKLTEASRAYYNQGEALMTDAAYDSLYDEFSHKFPESSFLQVVGATHPNNKFQHKHRMISMSKAKTFEQMQKWEDKILKAIDVKSLEYLATFKLDGISGKVIYENGVISGLYTRGDGNQGRDISLYISYLNIPTTIPCSGVVEVTGELILPKGTKVKNPSSDKIRNIAAGLLTRESDLSETHLIHFVAYNIIGDNIAFDNVSERYTSLENLGFEVLAPTVCNSLSAVNAFFVKYEEFLRDDLSYETDGLVIWVEDITLHEEINSNWVVDKYNHYNIAWKPQSESAETYVRDIEWNISPHGSLVPKAIFDMIDLMGSNVERCTLDNAENVINTKIAVGDLVEISLANDIIPHLEQVLTSKDEAFIANIPSACPHCNTALVRKGVHLQCPNAVGCPGQQEQRIINFVKELNPDGLGPASVSKLFSQGVISSIPSLLKLEYSDLEGLEGYKDSKITKTLEAIASMKSRTFPEIINSLAISLVGIKALKKLGISTREDFDNFNDPTLAIGQNIISWKSEESNITILDDILKEVDLIQEVSSDKGIVVMTGKAHAPRKELEAELQARGYEIGKSVSKDTTLLITNDPESTSSKCVKAKKLGIEITTYDKFF